MLKNVFKKSMAVLILLSMLFTNNGVFVYANSKPDSADVEDVGEFREVILDKFIDSLKIKKANITKIEFKKGIDGDTLTDGIKVQYDNNDVYINIEDGVIVKLPTDSSEYFCGLESVKEIKGLNLLDATNVKYAASMFEGPSKIKKLDLSSFSPNNLLETTDMFRNNAELEYINIENLDTSKVLDMVGMFNICPKLTTIDGISNMDTTSANSLDWMFYENKSMTTLDLTNWTVNSEISMSSCFVGCSELEKVYISDKWDENKRKIGSYINGTDGLSKIEFLEKEYKEDFDLGPLSMGSSEENTDFNETNDEKETNDTEIQISANNEEPEEDETETIETSEVVDDTSETVEIDETNEISETVEKEETSETVDTEETTETNEATETIESTAVNETTETTEVVGLNVDLSLKTENTTKKDVVLNKFVNDLSIDKLFIKTINFVIGTEGEEIADGIRAKIDGSDVYINIEEGVNAKLPKDMSGYFSKMYSLEEVKGFEYLDATEVENMEEMFSTNNNLKRVDLTGLKINNLLNAKNMFNNCPELKYINLGDLDTSKVENMKLMFSYCPKLEKIDGIENMKTDSVKNLDSIFEGDKNLVELNLSEWTIDENVSMVDSFGGLKKLETIYISNKWSKNRRNKDSKDNGTFGLTKVKLIYGNLQIDKIYKDYENVFTLDNGNVLKLEKDIELNTYLNIENTDIVLDLNGHKLQSPLDNYAIYVNNSTFTIIDSTYDKTENKNNNIVIDEIKNEFSGKVIGRSEKAAIYVNNSVVNFDGGFITGADEKVELVEENNKEYNEDEYNDQEESDYISLTNHNYDTSGNVYLNGAPAVMVKDSDLNINGAFIKGGDGKSYKEQRGADGAIAILTIYEKEDCKINLNSGVILGGKGGDGIKCNVSGSAGEGFIINNEIQNIAEIDNPIMHTTYGKEGGFGGGNGGCGINVIGNIKIDNIIKLDDIIITGGDGGFGDENELKSFKRNLYFKNGDEKNLPKKYDSRDLGIVTSAKNQSSTGWCWIFANCAVAETYMLKYYPDWCRQFLNKKTGEFDLSEIAVAKANLHASIAPLTDGKPTEIKHNHDSKEWMNAGGSPYWFSLLTSHDRAMVPEEIAPFKDVKCSNYPDNAPDNDKTIMYNKSYIFLGDSVDVIKNAVMENGSVYASIEYDSNYKNKEYFYSPYYNTNHGVQIVGWDDSISRNNFKEVVGEKGKVHKPSVDGAFLVKNSYGKRHGINGYLWVSYDTYCGASRLTYGPSNEYDYAYYYEEGKFSSYKSTKNASITYKRKGNKRQKFTGISVYTDSNVKNADFQIKYTTDSGEEKTYSFKYDLHDGNTFIDMTKMSLDVGKKFEIIIKHKSNFKIDTLPDKDICKITAFTKVADSDLENIEIHSNYLPKTTCSVKKGKNFANDSEFKKYIDNEYMSQGYIVEEGIYSDANYTNRILNFLTDINKKIYIKIKKVFELDGGECSNDFKKILKDAVINIAKKDLVYIKYDVNLIPTKNGKKLTGWVYEDGNLVELVKLNGAYYFKIDIFDKTIKAEYGNPRLYTTIQKPNYNRAEFNKVYDEFVKKIPTVVYGRIVLDSCGFDTIKGYIFKGYMFSFNDGKSYIGPTLEISYDMTCDIIIKPDIDLVEYKIQYELDGGVVKNNLSSFTVEDSDIDKKIILNDAYKDGYLFEHWNIKVFYTKKLSFFQSFDNITKNQLLTTKSNNNIDSYMSSDNIVTLKAVYSYKIVNIKYNLYPIKYIITSMTQQKIDWYMRGVQIDLSEDNNNLLDLTNELKDDKYYSFKGWRIRDEYGVENAGENGFIMDYNKCIYDEFEDIGGEKIKLLKSINKGGMILKHFKEGKIDDNNRTLIVEPYLLPKEVSLEFNDFSFGDWEKDKIKNIIFTNKDYSKYKNSKKENDNLYICKNNDTIYCLIHKDVKYIIGSKEATHKSILDELSKYNVSGFDLFDFSNVDLDVNIKYEFVNEAMWYTGFTPVVTKKFNSKNDISFNKNNIKLKRTTDFFLGFRVYGLYNDKIVKNYGYVDKLPKDQYLNYKVEIDVLKMLDITSDILFNNLGIEKTKITKINFTKTKPTNGTEKSIAKNLSAYVNGTEVNYYVSKGTIGFVENSSNLFAGLNNVKEITGLNVINYSNLKNMQGMFKNNKELTKVDFGNIYFVNVNNMKELFSGDTKLSTLSNFKTDTIKESVVKGNAFKDVNNLSLIKSNRKLLSNEESIVELDLNGGSYTGATWFIKGNSEYILPDVTRNGYLHVGWVYNDNLYTKIHKNSNVDVKFKAGWEKLYSNSDIKYISDIAVSYGSKKYLEENNYTVIDADLNDLAFNKVDKKYEPATKIYLGYKTTTNRNNAITNIVADVRDKDVESMTLKYDGIQYDAVTAGVRFTQSKYLKMKANLNYNADGKKRIYLFYTKNSKYSPITGIGFGNSKETHLYNYIYGNEYKLIGGSSVYDSFDEVKISANPKFNSGVAWKTTRRVIEEKDKYVVDMNMGCKGNLCQPHQIYMHMQEEKNVKNYITSLNNSYVKGVDLIFGGERTLYRKLTSTETYIKDIKMVVADKKTAENTFKNNDYIMISKNLNEGTSGREIYIGYTTTTNKSEAITAIGERWFNATGRNPQSYTGSYHKYNYTAVTDFSGKQWNTNEGGNSAARWVYLYTSKDTKAGSPIKNVEVLNYSTEKTINSLGQNNTYTVVANSNDNGLSDFNRGAGGDHIYIRYQK